MEAAEKIQSTLSSNEKLELKGTQTSPKTCAAAFCCTHESTLDKLALISNSEPAASSISAKAVACFPRVLLSVHHQPLSLATVGSQPGTLLHTTSSTVMADTCHAVLARSNLSTNTTQTSDLVATTSCPSTCETSTNQFLPLIFAAATTMSNLTSTVSQAPLQFHINSTGPTSPLISSIGSSVFFSSGAPSSTGTSSASLVRGGNLGHSSFVVTPTVVPSSGSLITSMMTRPVTSMASPAITPVVISPPQPHSISSTHSSPSVTLRFASPASIHNALGANALAANTSANSATCSLLLEASSITNQSLISSIQRSPHPCSTTALVANTTMANTPVTTVVTTSVSNVSTSSHVTSTTSSTTLSSTSLLMSSSVCPAPRVLLHKSLVYPPSSFASVLDANPSTTKLITSELGSHAAMASVLLHDQLPSGAVSHLQTPSKAKLVNLSAAVPANVRRVTSPAAAAIHPIKCTLSASGALNAAIQSGSHQPSSPVKPMGSWCGPTGATPVLISPTSANLVAVASSVQSPVVEAAIRTTTGDVTICTSNSTGTSQRLTTSIPIGIGQSGVTPVISSSTPTVLTFSLTTTTATAPLVFRLPTQTGSQLTINRPRSQNMATLFPQPNRKRARKQQLASTLPATVVRTSVNPSSAGPASNVTTATIVTMPTTTTTSVVSTVSTAPMTVSQSNIVHSESTSLVSSTLQPLLVGAHTPSRLELTGMTGSTATTTVLTLNRSHIVQPTGSTGAAGQSHLLSQPLTPTSKPYSGSIVEAVAVKSSNSSMSINLPTVNCPNAPSSGLLNLRLLPVRTPVAQANTYLGTSGVQQAIQPTSSLSTQRVGDTSAPLVMVAPSPGATQIRLATATPHSVASTDLYPAQATTVYVLTTSAYPILSNSASSFSNPVSCSGTVATTASNATTFMLPSATASGGLSAAGGLLQIRFRSSVPPCMTPDNVSSLPSQLRSENEPSRSASHLPISAFTACSKVLTATSDGSVKLETESGLSDGTSSGYRGSTVSSASSATNPLLHRHLVSPSHLLSMDEPSGNVDVTKSNAYDDAELPSRVFKSVSSIRRRCSIGRLDLSPVSETYLTPKTGVPTVTPVAAIDESNYPSNVEAAESSSTRLRKKRAKLDEVSGNEHSMNEDDGLIKCRQRGCKPCHTSVVLTYDPSDCREWILHNRPVRPAMLPKQYFTGTRSGSMWRAKSTHFLRPSEIRWKSDHRSELKSNRAGLSHRPPIRHEFNTRSRTLAARRRRGSRLSTDTTNRESPESSTDSRKLACERRLLHDFLSVRARQEELQFVNNPLTTSSLLNLTGWRALWCSQNFNLLIQTEQQSLNLTRLLESQLNFFSCSPSAIELELAISMVNGGNAAGSVSSPKTIRSDHFKSQPLPCCTQSTKSMADLKQTETLSGSAEIASTTDLHTEIDRVVDLIQGVRQRKLRLVESIRRLQFLTHRIVEEFSSKALEVVKDLDATTDTASVPETVSSTIASTSEKLSSAISSAHTGSDLCTDAVTLRRSTRNCLTGSAALSLVCGSRSLKVQPVSDSLENQEVPTSYPTSRPSLFLSKSLLSTSSSHKSVVCNGTPTNAPGGFASRK